VNEIGGAAARRRGRNYGKIRGIAANSQLEKGGGAEGAGLFTNLELPFRAPISSETLEKVTGFGEKGAPPRFVPVSPPHRLPN